MTADQKRRLESVISDIEQAMELARAALSDPYEDPDEFMWMLGCLTEYDEDYENEYGMTMRADEINMRINNVQATESALIFLENITDELTDKINNIR